MRKGDAVWRPNRILYALVFLAMFMSLGHHIDHVIRGNHVGWPLTAELNAFTYSLAVYPLILLGLFLYRSNRVGPGYWALLSGTGALFVAWIHFSPAAVEPPADIINLYEPPIIGWLAFLWLVVFVIVLVGTCLYELRSWFGQRKARIRPERGAASAIDGFLGEAKEGHTDRREADAPVRGVEPGHRSGRSPRRAAFGVEGRPFEGHARGCRVGRWSSGIVLLRGGRDRGFVGHLDRHTGALQTAGLRRSVRLVHGRRDAAEGQRAGLGGRSDQPSFDAPGGQAGVHPRRRAALVQAVGPSKRRCLMKMPFVVVHPIQQAQAVR